HRLGIAEIGLMEIRARIEIAAIAGGEVVDDAHPPAAREKGIGDVRADEPRAAGDEDMVSHVARIVAFLRIRRKAPASSAPKRKPPTCAHHAMPATSTALRAACSER